MSLICNLLTGNQSNVVIRQLPIRKTHVSVPLRNFNPFFSVQEDTKRTSTTKRQASKPSKDNDLDELELRQGQLFKQLEQLTSKLQHIKQQMYLVPTTTTSKGDTNADEASLASSDVVVLAPPIDYNPIALLIVYNFLSSKLKVRLSSHVHSSVTACSFAGELATTAASNNVAEVNLIITLIWKDVGSADPQLIVSPTKQGFVSGEVNILRYLVRSFPCDELCFDADPILATQIDHWLDVTHVSIRHGSNKECQGVLRALNSHLGKVEYLVGERFTIADVAMLGALLNQPQIVSTLQNNVKRWVKTCAKICSVSTALNVLGIKSD